MKTIFLSLFFLTSIMAQDLPTINLFPLLHVKESELPEVQIYNGKVKVLPIKLTDAVTEDINIYCEGQKIPFKIQEKSLEIYLIAGYYSKPRQFFCESENSKKIKVKFLKVTMSDFAYAEEKLNVDQSKVVLSKKDQKRVEQEQLQLNQIYSKRSPGLLFTSPFAIPMSSLRTSIYGNRRIINKTKISTHLGNDFRAANGTPVPVSNDGKVVFVGDLFFSGNTVIVDHGMEIFSMYAHLSAIKVKVDDVVKKSDIIALSGDTGRVSGPHLHWGVKINGEWIDGVSLADESEKIHF